MELSYEQRIGLRLRRKREIVGLSQKEVARAIGMVATQYGKLEFGGCKLIRFVYLTKLADVLMATTDYLLLRSDDMGVIPTDHMEDHHA